MSKLASLKAATSLSDVAALLHFKPKALAYILYKQSPIDKYRSFQIPKRNGGVRSINAPNDALKKLQRNLATLLQDCSDEITEASNRRDHTAHGFRRGKSIITNARRHRNRKWVFNVDLENFFPSINFGRVRGFFIKNRDFQLSADVATVLAQIACFENALPQGSPSSPVIANLITHLLDMRLVRIAAEFGCTYSRYADDLTFSTNKNDFPAQIARTETSNSAAVHSWIPGNRLQHEIEDCGFSLNDAKTHMMYRSSRQEVTGLIVNEKIGVRREYRHNVRAMVHALIKTGTFEIHGKVQMNGNAVLEKHPGTLEELQGMLGFIDSVYVCKKSKISRESLHETSARDNVHGQFLFYRTFYAAAVPIILCEGETDNIYLTHAIRSLAVDFPELAKVMPTKNKIELRIRLQKYTNSKTARLTGLTGGGSGVLANFIRSYNNRMKPISAPGLVNPVIVLFDNDDGSKEIWKAIRDAKKTPVQDSLSFIHVTRNLYAVPTPGKPSKIEDFFDEQTLSSTFEGKTFNDGKNIDTEKHYGKKIFAHRVIRPNAAIIDFSKFRTLLTNLSSAISAHQA